MRAFFNDLDTPGGHLLVCLALILLGAIFTKFGIPKAEDMIVGAVGVLFGSMRGRGGSPPPTVAPVTP
jgi:hypothetical protein